MQWREKKLAQMLREVIKRRVIYVKICTEDKETNCNPCFKSSGKGHHEEKSVRLSSGK